ncbi:hypothetical protein J2857_004383 [Neorhizobium galegae]|uniref:hypothetical protein n=1 Tax=Neorhizobium galegae TaxID=399 RepID=UPI001AE7048B|nr:hypothetical protein [Neorhizobium galegae]MBP2561593.1 hypothetical protein [Neorhizobium galegae]
MRKNAGAWTGGPGDAVIGTGVRGGLIPRRKKFADEFFEKLAARAVMVDHAADAGVAEAIATAAVAAPVMSAAPSAPISPAAPEAAGPSVASAAPAVQPSSRMSYVVAGLVAVIAIAALAA